jgi:hypothetical protein
LGWRHGAARSEIAAALEVLGPEPDGDTAQVLEHLAIAQLFSGNQDEAERFATDALWLCQALALGGVFRVRGAPSGSFRDSS